MRIIGKAAVLIVCAVAAAIVAGFVSLLASVIISPLQEWTQEAASCWGADSVHRQTQREIQQRTRNNSYGPAGASTFTLACQYGGETRQITNDTAVIKGFLLGTALGAAPAAILVLAIGTPVLVMSEMRRRP